MDLEKTKMHLVVLSIFALLLLGCDRNSEIESAIEDHFGGKMTCIYCWEPDGNGHNMSLQHKIKSVSAEMTADTNVYDVVIKIDCPRVNRKDKYKAVFENGKLISCRRENELHDSVRAADSTDNQ